MKDSHSLDLKHFITADPEGIRTLHMVIDGMHCPSCVALIESALKKIPDVIYARVNFSTRRLIIKWVGENHIGNDSLQTITNMGYRAAPFDVQTQETLSQRESKFLLRCLAIAGFASGNLMMFSIPIWSSDAFEIGVGTRILFYWIEAIIAIPAILYSGLPFYRSAWNALKLGTTNMDVPISVAVILATCMSLFETITHGKHAYFDSSVMLLFFLLIGRYLDAKARGKAREAAHDLLHMMIGFTTCIKPDGTYETIPFSDIKEGMVLLVAVGEKFGADGDISEGTSEIDTSIITGETLPQKIEPGSRVFAGMINITAPVRLTVTKAGERSLLSDIIKLMEVAEQSQAKYVTIAEKISSWYTPVVHALAAATFLGWWFVGGIEWQVALLYAATVLIITCPCALGLAVPVVQVLASGILMRRGILVKSGSALERLACITHIAFDKTGTLTYGKPELLAPESISPKHLQLAASMAVHSKHPLSQAIMLAYHGALLDIMVTEVPGYGLEAHTDTTSIKLGKRSWCAPFEVVDDSVLELWLSIQDEKPVRFTFADRCRDDAPNVVQSFLSHGKHICLLSGDRNEVVQDVAHQTGIHHAMAALSPTGKHEVLKSLKDQGAHILMVGDGLNDAPSLVEANVSMSPSTAMDITQNAADIVFQGEALSPVLYAWEMAVFSQRLVKQNFVLAILYNVVAIPLAVAGCITPLIAAIAMSSSSLLVVGNAMRLHFCSRKHP
ncbi:MAG: cadmium-translocating P-type ATPase [Alphaproteobacteria bacterium]|nr:cadmium-translocating P-type ATPase [Alphaproteobacteria bacterium]